MSPPAQGDPRSGRGSGAAAGERTGAGRDKQPHRGAASRNDDEKAIAALAAARGPAWQETQQGGALEFGILGSLGSLRVRSLYSQGGVEIDPANFPRTTSWLIDNSNFSTLEVRTKFDTAPPILGGRTKKTSPKKSAGDYQLVPEDLSAQSRRRSETQHDGLTKNQVVVYLVTAIIGCGVVVLPSLMAIGGWIVVPLIAGIVMLAFMEMGRVLDTAIRAADAKTNAKATTFEDIGRAAMDSLGVSLIRAVTGTGFAGTLVVYAMLIGQNIHGLLGERFSMKFVMLLVTPVLTFLALLKDETLANVMSIGMLASLGSCVLICIKGIRDARIWQAWPKDEHINVHSMWPSDPLSLGTVLAVMFSAFSVIGTVPCIRGQMEDPSQFLSAFQTALTIVFGMYLAVMLLGYWGYGNYVQHNVVNSMMFPPRTPHEALYGQGVEDHGSNNAIGICMAVLVTTYLFLGFSLFFKCIAGMVRNLLGDSPLYKEGTLANQTLRTIMVVSVVAIGLAVPHFRDVMAIMSSVCCSCNNVFFPLVFAYKLEYRPSRCRRIGHFFILLLGVFCVSLGLWSSLTNLVEEMRDASPAAVISQRNASTMASAMVTARASPSGVMMAAQAASNVAPAAAVASGLAATAAPAVNMTLKARATAWQHAESDGLALPAATHGDALATMTPPLIQAAPLQTTGVFLGTYPPTAALNAVPVQTSTPLMPLPG